MSFHVPEACRVTVGQLATDSSYGNNGLFLLPIAGRFKERQPFPLRCVASNGDGWTAQGLTGPPWEHVSVSTPVRTPTWAEMCQVKATFWDDEDVVMQLHPPKSEWVNCHEYCLHLWRPIGIAIPRPPSITVGPSNAR